MDTMKTWISFKSIVINSMWACLVIFAIAVSGCSESNKKEDDHDQVTFVDELDEPLENDFAMFEEEYADKAIDIDDPLEGINRFMFGVNDVLYFYALKPVSETYTWIVPKDVRTGVGNFFQNLATPARFVNCHLQGKVDKADIELKRFLINSTFGIAGIWDPALEDHGLVPPSEEDFGQTLAVYGVGDGCYLVLPLLGPSTLRDGAGQMGDMFLNPLFYLDPREPAYIATGTKYVNIASFHAGEYEDFKEGSVDPYVAMRDIYLQYRKNKIDE